MFIKFTQATFEKIIITAEGLDTFWYHFIHSKRSVPVLQNLQGTRHFQAKIRQFDDVLERNTS